MDFNLSDLQRMLLDSAERFIGERYSLEHRRSLRDTADGLDHDAWASMAELGWLALSIPEELDGLGGSLTDVAVLGTALGSRCVTEPLVSTAVIGAHLLAFADQSRTDLLAEIAGGTARFAIAHDEPGERYDYTGKRATRLTAAGSGFALSGQKMLALDAPSATHLIVTAQADDGLVLVLVKSGEPGISTDGYRLYDGSRAADIRFENVAVPAEAVLARGDSARTLLLHTLDRARLANAAQMIGSMESELEICSAYLKERQQFGQPIGKFQSLQHIMADMFVAAHQARSILYFALSNIDAEPAQREKAVSLARLNINEAAMLIARHSIQLHGGYGVTDEYEVSHHYRRQIVLEKAYGDTEFHLSRLG
jgi:alkylation response protein AidB-like acyl-CoA dehydrogenase